MSCECSNSVGGVNPIENFGMKWQGQYINKTYFKNDVVLDGAWTMIANKETTDQAAPQPNGEPVYTLGDTPAWVTQSNNSVVYSGQEYTFTKGGWLRGVRVWIPELTANTNYRFILADITNIDDLKVTIIEEPVLNVNQWNFISLGSLLIASGKKFRFYIDALNSGTNTTINGGWAFQGRSDTLIPTSGGWAVSSNRTLLRINKTDLDSVFRGTELLGVIPDSTFSFIQVSNVNNNELYRVTNSLVDQGTYIEYPVTRIDNNGTIGTNEACNAEIIIPIADPTKYVQINNYWPTNQPDFATVEGFLEFDGVSQPATNNAYGIDVLFQNGSISNDWELVSYSGG